MFLISGVRLPLTPKVELRNVPGESQIMRVTIKILVAVLTLTLGVGTSSLRHRWHDQMRLSTSDVMGPRRTYAREMHFDAARGSLWLFSSSDGRKFNRWTITCGSPELAKKKMEELLGKSAQIVSREVVRGARGERLGEEVVAVFPLTDTENGVASLFHVDQSEYLVQITSSSLENILDFRNDYLSAR